MPKSQKKKIKVVYKKLGRSNVYGFAYIDDGYIEIDSRLKKKRQLGVICHECLHLAFPEANETTILKAEKIIADVLWQEGFRLKNNEKTKKKKTKQKR